MTTPAAAPLLKMLLAQTRSELLIRWRVPAFSVTNLVLPIVFFIFFGLPIAHLRSADGVSIGAYLLASFGAYAVGNVMVYGFGIGVANERGMKIEEDSLENGTDAVNAGVLDGMRSTTTGSRQQSLESATSSVGSSPRNARVKSESPKEENEHDCVIRPDATPKDDPEKVPKLSRA